MSERYGIEPEVKNFFLKDIYSLEHLEILLLLYANPDLMWSSSDVSNRLRSNIQSVERWLDMLYQQKLVVKQVETQITYSFAADYGGIVAKVARAYSERRVRVLELIFSKPLERIQVFADAFKITRKDKKDG